MTTFSIFTILSLIFKIRNLWPCSVYDYLNGGSGADRFILGDSTWIGYDDGSSTGDGGSDYADISDFNIGGGDIIQLKGTSTDYLLAVSGADTQILLNKPGSEPDEIIGIVRYNTALSLTASYFAYIPDTVVFWICGSTSK